MKSLNFSDGRKEFCICGDESRIIRVNLTDDALIVRLEKAFDAIRDLVKEYTDLNDDEVLDKLEELQNKVREQINYAFDYDVCTPVFGRLSPFALVDGDMLVFRFFDAIMPEIEAAMEDYEKAKEASNKRVQKYTQGL